MDLGTSIGWLAWMTSSALVWLAGSRALFGGLGRILLTKNSL
jgi:hypothetical protein